MTGFLFFLLLITAVAAALEAQHRHVRRLGPEAPRRSRHRRGEVRPLATAQARRPPSR